MMALKVGDNVRFLNSSGGGIVSRVDGRLVFVEDQDGFEIPVMINEVVFIDAPKVVADVVVSTEEADEDDTSYEFEEGAVEDSNPRFYFAILSGEKDGVDSGNVRLSVINDCNYFAFYSISSAENDGKVKGLYSGLIEPNTKLHLGKSSLLSLDDQQWRVDVTFYKKGKSYLYHAPVSSVFKFKAARFYKENSFVVNDFFHVKAILFSVVKDEFEQKLEQLSSSELKKVSQEKEKEPIRKVYAKRDEPGILEVDLHIHELVDSYSHLSNTEIITIQLARFKHVMESNVNNKGRKLVFIHGVGSGTLKTEVRKLLDREYRKHNYQDASFKEYGYGATMVIV